MSRQADARPADARHADARPLDAYTAEHRKIARAFGANLQMLRTADGHSQESLARAARLHRTQISFMERGLRAPGLLIILILADALRVTPDVLLECLPVPKERKPYRDIHREERDPLAWMSPRVDLPPPESD
jgi:transcriptional regulator with XRE-family HTH domain